MKIAIFGAAGGTGRQVARQALDRGHDVVAVVRDPSKFASALPEQRRTDISRVRRLDRLAGHIHEYEQVA